MEYKKNPAYKNINTSFYNENPKNMNNYESYGNENNNDELDNLNENFRYMNIQNKEKDNEEGIMNSIIKYFKDLMSLN
jgi:hypothetical protein